MALGLVLSLSLAIFLGLGFFTQPVQFHPYLVVQLAEHFQLTFLQSGKPTRNQCDATMSRMSQALSKVCPACKLIESRCVEKLDVRQRKLLQGQPVDIPVMRTQFGIVAFTGASPELAMGMCQEAGRQGSDALPGSTRCAPPSFESLALSLTNFGGTTAAYAPLGAQALVTITLVALGISYLLCFIIVRSQRLHGRFTYDRIESGPQKFHSVPVPRIGGLALAAALAASIIVLGRTGWIRPTAVDGLTMLAFAAIPAFAGGLSEDVTRRVGVLARLMLTISAGVIASLLVGATLDRVDVPGIDALLQWPIFAIAFTAFAVGGIANAINIIDGYNGLAGGYAVLVLAAFAFVAFKVGDPVVLSASLAMGGALVGFLIWNYPSGKIFLGDGGAYLLGFWLAELSVLLVARNPDVSPWFPLLLLSYPIIDTLFAIFRKKYLRNRSAGSPDGLHFQMLIYKRLVRVLVSRHDPASKTVRNSLVSVYVWAMTMLLMIPAIAWWDRTPWLMGALAVFCVAYLWLYRRMLCWNSPNWLILRRWQRSRAGYKGT